MRDRPTIPAPPYIAGPITQREDGHQRLVSAVTAAAAEKAATAWPDGNERCPSSPANPPMKRHLKGLKLVESTYGRCRPNTPFMPLANPSPINNASVPCNPRSAVRCDFVMRPTAYIDVPMIAEPGSATTRKSVAAWRNRPLF